LFFPPPKARLAQTFTGFPSGGWTVVFPFAITFRTFLHPVFFFGNPFATFLPGLAGAELFHHCFLFLPSRQGNLHFCFPHPWLVGGITVLDSPLLPPPFLRSYFTHSLVPFYPLLAAVSPHVHVLFPPPPKFFSSLIGGGELHLPGFPSGSAFEPSNLAPGNPAFFLPAPALPPITLCCEGSPSPPKISVFPIFSSPLVVPRRTTISTPSGLLLGDPLLMHFLTPFFSPVSNSLGYARIFQPRFLGGDPFPFPRLPPDTTNCVVLLSPFLFRYPRTRRSHGPPKKPFSAPPPH